MIRQLTIKCDWPACCAELTFEFRTLRPDAPGWKVETDGVYSLHLCPKHNRKSWSAVRDAQFAAGQAPSTSW
jgi:hypothetical protein